MVEESKSTMREELTAKGHWCPENASPLIVLMMRNLAQSHVGKPGPDRKSLGSWILERRGKDEDLDHGDLYGIADHVIRSLPAEVIILSGGCGGEATIACYTESGYSEAFGKFTEYWLNDDPMWPVVERIPLVKA